MHVRLVCVRNEYKVSVWTDAHADVTRISVLCALCGPVTVLSEWRSMSLVERTQRKDMLALSRLN